MTHLIHCIKLNKEAESLAQPPFPGTLGQKIYENISKEAWQLWLNHQTMLINEYRLSTIDPKARTFLLQEMENFLFGSGSNKPTQYVEPEK
ncbi:MAG: oxidative damage protection protein [Gammaproteobacteria bacterium RIFCSPHIGHO2_12_FULL_37_34]|nr:MAG: oxidative damage protection protein [Gammaproteobacteria bacterium RIFCSPHIGHO2_12_FULL_37_34]